MATTALRPYALPGRPWGTFSAKAPADLSNTIYYIVTRLRNKWGLVSQNTYARMFEVEPDGSLYAAVPSTPLEVELLDTTGGKAQLRAEYHGLDDLSAADYWRYRTTMTGVDPTTAEPYTDIAVSSAALKRLRTIVGPYPIGTDLRVLVSMYRSSDMVEGVGAVAQLTVGTEVPGVTILDAFLGQFRATGEPILGVIDPVIYCVGENIFATVSLGRTELWIDTDLIFAAIYDSGNPGDNGFWTTYGYDQTAVSGIADETPVDCEGYIVVDGIRTLQIDTANSLLICAALDNGTLGDVTDVAGNAPFVAGSGRTALKVLDPTSGVWVAVADLDTDGLFTIGIGYAQVGDVGDIPS